MASIRRINDPVIRGWYEKALAFGVKRGGTFFEVKPGTQERDAWEIYFQRLGWTPRGFWNDSWTAPCQFPGELDWVENPHPKPPRQEAHTFEQKAAMCHSWLRVLDMPDASWQEKSKARQEIVRFDIPTRKRAMAMSMSDAVRVMPILATRLGSKRLHEFKPLPRHLLTTITYTDKTGKTHTSGEPYFLPEWDGPMPPNRDPGDCKPWFASLTTASAQAFLDANEQRDANEWQP